MRWRKGRWERRTAAGAVVAGMALGLRDSLDREDEDTVPVVVDDAGAPPPPKVTLYFHPTVPEATLALVH